MAEPAGGSLAHGVSLMVLQARASGRRCACWPGLSNAEPAAGLVVSERRVKTHVGDALAKLGLRDRGHAVVFAHEAGVAVPGQD